jgi:hypothetical protein
MDDWEHWADEGVDLIFSFLRWAVWAKCKSKMCKGCSKFMGEKVA